MPCVGAEHPSHEEQPLHMAHPPHGEQPSHGELTRVVRLPGPALPRVAGGSMSQPPWQDDFSCTSPDAWGWSWDANKGQHLSSQTQTPHLSPCPCLHPSGVAGRGQAPLDATVPLAPAPK